MWRARSHLARMYSFAVSLISHPDYEESTDLNFRCFTCGEVDGDHEARNCPVTLVCLSCGSRGHVSRVSRSRYEIESS